MSRNENPAARRAWNAVTNAKADGRLVRPNTCSSCGKTCEPQAHHHKGYDARLDIEWLCSGCHAAVHHPNGHCAAAKVFDIDALMEKPHANVVLREKVSSSNQRNSDTVSPPHGR
jgi:hypothetical protein